MIMIEIELDSYQIRIIFDLVANKISYGSDPYQMRGYMALFEKFREIIKEENNINE